MVAMLSKTAAALLALVPAGCVELKLALKIDSDADGVKPKKVSLRANRSNTPSEEVTKCSNIKSSRDCYNSDQLYGLKCGGWGGISCISSDSKCEELQGRDRCNKAWANHKLHCVGFAVYGEERVGKCLGYDLDVKQIKDKRDCEIISGGHHHAKGWSGKRCIAKTETDCSVIEEPVLCRNAAKVGFDCKGWGGSRCLAKTADGSEITERGICMFAKENLGMEVRGWGGDKCISDQNAQCKNIRDKDICEDAANRLNMQCGGWKDNWCQDPTPKTKDGQELGPQTPRFPAHCNEVLDEILCNQTSARYGMLCGWDAGAASCITG